MNAPQTYRPCPACSSQDIANLDQFDKEHWRIGQCTACDFVFLRNPVEYESLEEDFAWEKTYKEERAKRIKNSGFAKKLARKARLKAHQLRGDRQRKYRRLLGEGKILDIGCGNVVRWTAPFVPYGIEISKRLHAEADERMRKWGGECFHGAGAERIFSLPEDHFDSVMMYSYLEHEVRYREVLEGSFRCLKPGGKAFIRVPNFSALNRFYAGAKWPGFRYPDHVNYFTQTTLRKAAEEAVPECYHRARFWLCLRV